MKTEQEIKEEIKASERTIENYRLAYKNGKVPFNVLELEVNNALATISALAWVLGENERFD